MNYNIEVLKNQLNELETTTELKEIIEYCNILIESEQEETMNDCEGCGKKIPLPTKECVECYHDSLIEAGEDPYKLNTEGIEKWKELVRYSLKTKTKYGFVIQDKT